MEVHVEKSPRVGPGSAGESHTPVSAGDRAAYTGGPKYALEEERMKEAERNDDFGKCLTDSDRHIDSAAMLTADEEGGSRAATPASLTSSSKFYRTPGTTEEESGNETAASHTQERNRDRFLRKRRGAEDSPPKNGKDRESLRKPAPKRGRGRPPTTGEYVGLAEAKRKLAEEKERELELEAERQILESATRIPQLRSHRLSESSLSDVTMAEDRVTTAASLGAVIAESLKAITEVAQKSKNLKGTSVAALRKATCAIQEACAALISRSTSEETKALEIANVRLSKDLAEVKQELEAVKRKLADAQPHPVPTNKELDVEELIQRAVSGAVAITGARMDARLEALEARLLPEPRLRPPLASDRREKENAAAPATSSEQPQKEGKGRKTRPPEPPVTTLMPPTNPGPAPKKAKKKKSAAATEAAAARTDAATSAATSKPAPASEWTRVGRNGKASGNKEGGKTAATKGKKEKKKKRGQLRTPKSAAVVLTLLPEAEKRGVSYKDVIDRAKKHIVLADLDIPAVKFKVAVTGARKMEIPGTASGDKANKLAEKLKEVLKEEDVRVSLPQKCAELRMFGLDDSATAEEIARAIAVPGGCATDDIKVGEIRRDRKGLGTAWIKCPVEAAKKVTAPSVKIYVGWTVVRVELLSARPLRCFRCQELGHTRSKCPSEEDRSSLCFRCGQPGHEAAKCEGKPHCALCAARGKPADHSVGTKACDNNALRKKAGSKKSPAQAKAGSEKSHAPEKPATTSTAASSAGAVPMEAS